MRMQTPPQSTRRLLSPDQKNWVDIVNHGEIAMSATKFEFKTSFAIEGVNSFIFVDGECLFKNNDTFMLWGPKGILIYYIQEKECLHLTADEISGEGASFVFKDMTAAHPQVEVYSKQGLTHKFDLSTSMQMFKPGRGFL